MPPQHTHSWTYLLPLFINDALSAKSKRRLCLPRTNFDRLAQVTPEAIAVRFRLPALRSSRRNKSVRLPRIYLCLHGLILASLKGVVEALFSPARMSNRPAGLQPRAIVWAVFPVMARKPAFSPPPVVAVSKFTET